MIPISLKQLAIITQGTLQQINDQQADNLWLNSIEINSRQQHIDGLFIALKGKHFDGHCFIKEAIIAGARALLVDRPLSTYCPHVVVKNTLVAMGKLASWVRLQSRAIVFGLTGSSGKTSVKEILAVILSKCGMTLFTKDNLNNAIGVFLTLFRLTTDHQYAVIEIGANHIGEIGYIASIVKPDVVLVNNIFNSHLEGFGSLDGVAKAKGEIFQGLSKQGTAVINLASNDWKNWKFYFKRQQNILSFSLSKDGSVDFYAENIIRKLTSSKFNLHTPIGVIPIFIPLPGIHNISNALAASALAVSVGVTLEQISYGLSHVKPILGRLCPIYLSPGKLILDDTYNANVGSIIAAAETLSSMPGYRVLVVGDISELGNKAEKCYKEIGRSISQLNIDLVFSVGRQSIIISKFNSLSGHFISKKKLIIKLISLIKKYKIISVLIKGSRDMKMEEIVYALKEYFYVNFVS